MWSHQPSRGGRFVAIGHGPPGATRVWELGTGRLVGECPTTANGTEDGPEVLSADGRLLIDFQNALWDVPTGTERLNLNDPDGWPAYACYFSQDDRTLVVHRAVKDVGYALCWFDIASGQEDVTRRLVLLPDVDGIVGTERATDGRLSCLVRSERPAGWLARQAAGLHPSFAPLAKDRLKSWRVIVDPETGRVVAELPGDEEYLGLTADGTGVLTGGPELSRVRVWDIPPRKPFGWLVGLSVGWGVTVGLVGRWLGRRVGRRG